MAAMLNLGRYHEERGDTAAARDAFRRVFELDTRMLASHVEDARPYLSASLRLARLVEEDGDDEAVERIHETVRELVGRTLEATSPRTSFGSSTNRSGRSSGSRHSSTSPCATRFGAASWRLCARRPV